MNETGVETGRPRIGVVVIDDEGVDSVQRLEVVEVREQGVRSEGMKHANVDPPGVSEETAFAHVRQEAELIVRIPRHIEGHLFWGENAQVVSWSET